MGIFSLIKTIFFLFAIQSSTLPKKLNTKNAKLDFHRGTHAIIPSSSYVCFSMAGITTTR